MMYSAAEEQQRREAGIAPTPEQQAMRVAIKHILAGHTQPTDEISRTDHLGRMSWPTFRRRLRHCFTTTMYTTAFHIARRAHLAGNIDLI